MSPEKKSKDPVVETSLWGAVTEVVRGLSKQPALLFGFGLAILLLAAGGLAFENLRMIAIALIGLGVIAFAGWILNAALKRKAGAQPNKVRIRSGDAHIAPNAQVDKESHIKGGSIDGELSASGNLEMRAGDATVGKGANVKKSTVEGGDIKINIK